MVMLGHQNAERASHCVAPLRNHVAVAPDAYPAVVRGRAHTHSASERLCQLIGKRLPSASASARNDSHENRSQLRKRDPQQQMLGNWYELLCISREEW